MLNKNDPLIGPVLEVMKRNELEREAKNLVNEHFGIQDRKALPHEYHSEWDAVYNQVLSEMSVDDINAALRTPPGRRGDSSSPASRATSALTTPSSKPESEPMPAPKPAAKPMGSGAAGQQVSSSSSKPAPAAGIGPGNKPMPKPASTITRSSGPSVGPTQEPASKSKTTGSAGPNRGLGEELKGSQHKIDVAAPFGKLTKHDFKKLRSMEEGSDPNSSDVTSPTSMKIKRPDYAPPGTKPDYANKGPQMVNRAAKTSLPPGTVEKAIKEENLEEKAVSKAQQRFMGLVRGIQKGKAHGSAKAEKAAETMSAKEVKKYAGTKQKGLPEKVSEAAQGAQVMSQSTYGGAAPSIGAPGGYGIQAFNSSSRRGFGGSLGSTRSINTGAAKPAAPAVGDSGVRKPVSQAPANIKGTSAFTGMPSKSAPAAAPVKRVQPGQPGSLSRPVGSPTGAASGLTTGAGSSIARPAAGPNRGLAPSSPTATGHQAAINQGRAAPKPMGAGAAGQQVNPSKAATPAAGPKPALKPVRKAAPAAAAPAAKPQTGMSLAQISARNAINKGNVVGPAANKLEKKVGLSTGATFKQKASNPSDLGRNK